MHDITPRSSRRGRAETLIRRGLRPCHAGRPHRDGAPFQPRNVQNDGKTQEDYGEETDGPAMKRPGRVHRSSPTFRKGEEKAATGTHMFLQLALSTRGLAAVR